MRGGGSQSTVINIMTIGWFPQTISPATVFLILNPTLMIHIKQGWLLSSASIWSGGNEVALPLNPLPHDNF